MKYYIMAVAITIAALNFAFAQKHSNKRSDYKLLWKISGNNLKKPSYLFGTMHVQDDKAFNFSDSVLLKISECEAFALEVHPDTLSEFAIKSLLTENTGKSQLRDLLSAKEYRKLDSLMILRTGYSLDKFNSPFRAKHFLQNQVTKKDKGTFLDAWLYNIANQQNKIIVGLEDMKTHGSVFQDTKQDLKDLTEYLESGNTKLLELEYESMLDIYYEGDVERMRDVMKQLVTPAKYDLYITQRNIGMVNNITKVIGDRSMFIAVGAAHLGGEEGMISLLKKQGFSVTPVAPTFTNLASKYRYTVTEKDWVKFTSSEGGYSIETPSRAIPFKPGAMPFTFQSCFDMTVPALYMATAIPNPSQQSFDNLFEVLKNNMTGKGKVLATNKITVHGLRGVQFDYVSTDKQYYRVQVIDRNVTLYMLMVGSPNRSITKSAEAKRFLESFKLTSAPVYKNENYENKAGAFSIFMPAPPKLQTINATDPESGRYTLNMVQSIDMSTGEVFIVRYNDFPQGYISTNDSLYVMNTLYSSLQNTGGINLKYSDVNVSGFKGLKFSFELTEKNKNLKLNGVSVMRGNRYYMAIATRPPHVSEKAADKFLSTLSFTSYKPTATKKVDLSRGLSVMVPDYFNLDSALSDNLGPNELQYEILDHATGMVYMINFEEFGKYSEVSDKQMFLDKLVNENLTNPGDTILRKSNIQGENYFGIEYDLRSKQINAIRRTKTIIAGRNAFTLYGYLPADYKLSNFPDAFFNSLTITNNDNWNLSDDKTDKLLKDIASPDSTIQDEAERAILEHTFKKIDLPKIYASINKTYADDNNESGSVKEKLLAVLEEVNDSTTMDFIVSVYPKLSDNNNQKPNALSVLTSLKTESSAKQVLKILKAEKPENKLSGYFLSNLSDSLKLLNHVLPELLTLEKKFIYPSSVFSIVQSALDSGALLPTIREKVIQEAVRIGQDAAKTSLRLPEDDQLDYKISRVNGVTRLLTSVPFTSEVKRIFQEILQCGNSETMITAALHLLKNHVPVEGSIISQIAEDRLWRIDLYDQLNEIEKSSLIQPKFLTPLMIAESDLYEYLYYEYAVAGLEFLKEVKISQDGEAKQLFVFKYRVEDDENWYIGIAGPYPLQGTYQPQRGDMTYGSNTFYENDELLRESLIELLSEYNATLID